MALQHPSNIVQKLESVLEINSKFLHSFESWHLKHFEMRSTLFSHVSNKSQKSVDYIVFGKL